MISEVVDDDGAVARGERLKAFARKHRLTIVTMADLITHRRRTERLVEFKAESRLPTHHGVFRAHGFRSVLDGREHIALVMGAVRDGGDEPTLVRVHSECLMGNVFDSGLCDCSVQLDHALRLIAAEGRGVVVYLRGHEGRGVELFQKPHASYHLDTQSDARDYGVGAQILAELGVQRMRLLTDNPVKRIGLEAYGLEVCEVVRMPVDAAPQSTSC